MKRPQPPQQEVLQQLGVVATDNTYYIKELNKYIDYLETSQKQSDSISNVSNSLDLRELERKLDEALGKETRETLTEWLKQQRQ